MEYLVNGIEKINLLFRGKESFILTPHKKILDQKRSQCERKAITLITAQ